VEKRTLLYPSTQLTDAGLETMMQQSPKKSIFHLLLAQKIVHVLKVERPHIIMSFAAAM
jgi:hypothetical protein